MGRATSAQFLGRPTYVHMVDRNEFCKLTKVIIIIIIIIRAPGRSARHHALNDLIARSFASAGVPVTKEPIGLFRSDRKRAEWSHTRSVAKRQVVVLGRHSILPSGRVICHRSRP